MTLKELYRLKILLLRIKTPSAHVDECRAYVEKDIALREQQSKAQRDNKYEDLQLY